MDKEMFAALARSKGFAVGLASVLSAAASAAVTAGILMKRFEKQYQERLDEELLATQKFYTVLNKTEFKTPADAAAVLLPDDPDEADEMVEYLEKKANYDEGNNLTEVVRNVFTDAETYVWDPDAEEALRDPGKPYILEHDEFYESDRIQSQLTWFEGDSVLADDKDEHIPDIDSIVGEGNLDRFGHGSRDPNILYIRNEHLDIDFEIVRNEGKYSEQILGFIQHEDAPRRVHKFRLQDER